MLVVILTQAKVDNIKYPRLAEYYEKLFKEKHFSHKYHLGK